MNLEPGATVYLDTNAWNSVLDWQSRRSVKWLAGPVYLFSSCNLDEFALAPPARARDLASFAWRITNRQKLLDHVELTAAELAAYRRGTEPDYFDHRDQYFGRAWGFMRSLGADPAMQAGLREWVDDAKRQYQAHLQDTRDLLGPYFRKAAELGVEQDWPALLEEMAGETEIRQLLAASLREAGIGTQRANIAALENLDYRVLPGTACGIQYHLALSFLAAQRTGKLSKPDYGDQVDFRHAYYAGIADVYVTGDRRMFEILTTMVPSLRARVLTREDFIGLALG